MTWRLSALLVLAAGAVLAVGTGPSFAGTSPPPSAAPTPGSPGSPSRGGDLGIELQVPNGGPSLARPDSWVSFPAVVESTVAGEQAFIDVALPAGLQPGVRIYRIDKAALGEQLECRPVAAYGARCYLPPTTGSDLDVEVFIPTGHSQTPGGHGTVTFHIRPVVGRDPNPANDAARTAVTFVPATDVTWTFSRTHADVAVGKSVDATFTVRNVGTAPTPQLTGQFRFDPSLDEANPPFNVPITGPGIFGGGGSLPFHAGPLRPGATAVYHVTVEPLKRDARITISVEDDTFSPTPGCFDAGCGQVATLTVTAAPPGSTGPTGGGLAGTGVAVDAQLSAALAALVLGTGLVVAGRRRRPG